MDNKEYGVKLTVDISDLEKNLEKAKSLTENTKKSIEEPLRKVKITRDDKEQIINIKADTKQLENQLKETAEEFEKRMANIKPKIFRNDVFNPDADADYRLKELFGDSEEEKTYWRHFREIANSSKVSTSEVKREAGESLNKVVELKNEIDELVEKYNEISKRKQGELFDESDIYKVQEYKTSIREAVEELNQLTGKRYGIKGITDDFSDLSDEVEEAGDNASKTTAIFARFGDDVSKTIKKSVANLKRFSLSLFGIHSVWTALSRAVRSYMAYDTEVSNKIQANWIALGAMFAPIVENVIKWVQKLVAYINVFYKALTGKSFIQTALDKVKDRANGTSKAVKGLNKELATFDEITNINFDKGNEKDLEIASALQELEDIELDENIKKQIEEIAKSVKEFWNWLEPKIKEIWGWLEPKLKKIKEKMDEWGIDLGDILFTAGLIYGAFKFTEISGGIAQVIGVVGGTTGLYGMLTLFGMLIDFGLAYKLGKELEEYSDVIFDTKETQEDLGDENIRLLQKNKEKLEEIKEKLKDNNLSEEKRQHLLKIQGQLIENSQELYYDFNEAVATGKYRTKEQKEEVQKLAKEIEHITNTEWKAEIDLQIKAVSKDWITQKVIDFIFGGAYGVLNDWNLFGIEVKKNRNYGSNSHGFAKGNVAYEPTQAEFGEYAGARSNPEITAPQDIMKQTMLEALQEANLSGNSKGGDTILYVNGKELARATYNDYKEEGNRLGSTSVAIRRV